MFLKRKSKKAVLWGATGQALVLSEFVGALGYSIVAIFDNDINRESLLPGVPIYFGEDGFSKWVAERNAQEFHYLVAIGGWKGADRVHISDFLSSRGLIPATVVHPTAYVSGGVRLAEGAQILSSSFIGANTFIGKQVIVNSMASVDHECAVLDGAHVSAGAVIAGCVEIGENSFIGTGAVVVPRITIGKNVVVGAGSVVTKPLPDNVVAYGNPAKIVRHTR